MFGLKFGNLLKKYNNYQLKGGLFNYCVKMSKKCCEKLDKSAFTSEFLNSLDFILTDCDGVLWLGNTLIPGSLETIHSLHKLGKKIIYITNNSTRTRDEYLVKLKNFGFPVELDSIFSSAYCLAWYFQNINFTKKVYILGSTGIAGELKNVGIQSLPVGPDILTKPWLEHVSSFTPDPEVGAVVAGFDEHVSYLKIFKASSYLENKNCLFVVTNTDKRFPAHGAKNIVVPGTGSVVEAVKSASGREPIVIGKPHKYIFECIKKKFPKIDPARSIMIGDNLHMDILFGTRNGLRTLFVLSGVSTLEEVKIYEKSPNDEDKNLIPDFYVSCLGDLKDIV